MASDDLNSTIKNLVQTLGQFVNQWTAPGQTVSTTVSPAATIITALGTASLQVIGSSVLRRRIEFWNSNPTGTAVWIVPAGTTAVIGRGIYLAAGSSYAIGPDYAANAAFNAIATTGSANVLTIIEFY